MSARRIAREIAVVVLPQLPKDKDRLEKMEFDVLIAKSVQMLVDHAKQCLSEANGFILKGQQQLLDTELYHEKNSLRTDTLSAVPLTSGQLKEQLELLEIALHLISEALDLPEMALASDVSLVHKECTKCGHKQSGVAKKPATLEVKDFVQRLVGVYLEHRQEIDDLIANIKTKWRIERMVSIDRDILRLACAEAFYMPDVPINVVVSEAVELCHRFADQRAAKFVNGVLSDLVEQAEQYRQSPGAAPNIVQEDGASTVS
ncbi:MAG: transcription antitermination factor NusB [Candidatus Obscuribacterales bacterium]|nr:transcription antitermination factor NusB [Candidatus Obscuribacterales bacterium]